MERTSILTGLVLSLALLHLDAQGGPVTFYYEGVVTELAPDIPPGSPFSDLNLGDIFSGIVTFDSGSGTTGSETSLVYWDSIIEASGTLGSISFGGPLDGTNAIVVINDRTLGGLHDTYSINFLASYGGSFPTPTKISIVDPSATMFSDLSLPFTPPDLTNLDSSQRVFRIGSNDSAVDGVLTTLLLVPEPATFLLLSIGCLVLVRHRDTARKAMVAR